MKKYWLLTITWIIILGFNIYRLHNGFVDTWLWVLFIAIAIVPVADRLKIGNLFDFGSKSKSDKDVQDSFRITTSSIQNLILNVSSQEQVHMESIVPPTPSLNNDDVLTEHDKKMIEFMYNADQALYGLSCLIKPLYAAFLIRSQSQSLNNARFTEILNSVHDAPLRKIVEECKEKLPTMIKISMDKADFEASLELINLRELIPNNEERLQDIDILKTVVQRVFNSVHYFSGMIDAGISIALNPAVLSSVIK